MRRGLPGSGNLRQGLTGLASKADTGLQQNPRREAGAGAALCSPAFWGASFANRRHRRNCSLKIMIRRGESGLSIYVPKKDLEEPIVESEFETLWGGWIKIANGWVLDLPALAADTRLPITVEAKKRAEAEEAE
jgi:nitrogen fixation protein NifT